MLTNLNRILEHPEGYEFWGAVAGAAISGIAGASGAKKAASAQKKAAALKLQATREQAERAEAELRPYAAGGLQDYGTYRDIVGRQAEFEEGIISDVPQPFQFGAEEFEQYKDPGYAFRLGEGERAVSRGFAGGGKRFSGERYAGLQEYGQRMASQEFGAARGRALSDYESQVARERDVYQRSLGKYGRQYEGQVGKYGGLADIGFQAARDIVGVGQEQATGERAAYGARGEAEAAGTLGQYGAYSKAIGDIGGVLTGTGRSGGGFDEVYSSRAIPISEYSGQYGEFG